MKLHNLKPAKGAVKKNKRIARGPGSGGGGTAGRGHKGQKSRSGFSRKRAHEGGQMPLQMRLPKRGFKNPNRVAYVPMNVSRLQIIADKYKTKTIDIETLTAHGIITKNDRVKILGKGEISAGLTVSAHAVSGAAQEAIEKAGGKVNIV